uniref:Uncharacterized protein n=1 Tax=Vespula pensylvanica TaxID=30213 RepID=A0A834P824_VESPE|nr:hypothetical protein H0235_004785 [Vespula pensylvanica]
MYSGRFISRGTVSTDLASGSRIVRSRIKSKVGEAEDEDEDEDEDEGEGEETSWEIEKRGLLAIMPHVPLCEYYSLSN